MKREGEGGGKRRGKEERERGGGKREGEGREG